MSHYQTINGETFNVDAIQKIVGRAMREAYPSERAMIEVVSRLIAAYRTQAARDLLQMQVLQGVIRDLESRLEPLEEGIED